VAPGCAVPGMGEGSAGTLPLDPTEGVWGMDGVEPAGPAWAGEDPDRLDGSDCDGGESPGGVARTGALLPVAPGRLAGGAAPGEPPLDRNVAS